MEKTPISLLEKLRAPAPQVAWERFVQLYTPLLCHWAGRLGLSGPDAEDLVQDVFAILLQRLPSFAYDPRQRFRAWLWTVTVNKHRARLRRRADGEEPIAQRDMEPAVPDNIEAVIEADYQQFVVQRALQLMQNEFQPATWQAFWECTVNARPASEVAAELQMRLDSVYTAKSRVLRRLRTELKELLD